eukprot:g81520.t1
MCNYLRVLYHFIDQARVEAKLLALFTQRLRTRLHLAQVCAVSYSFVAVVPACLSALALVHSLMLVAALGQVVASTLGFKRWFVCSVGFAKRLGDERGSRRDTRSMQTEGKNKTAEQRPPEVEATQNPPLRTSCSDNLE